MQCVAQDAEAAATRAVDTVSAVLAVVESMEGYIATTGKCPGFQVERDLVAHLAAHVSRQCVGFACNAGLPQAGY